MSLLPVMLTGGTSIGSPGTGSGDRRYIDAVEDHNADNTGSGNTHTELQAAIDAASADNLLLYIPPGTYRIADTLDLDNVRIVAYGAVLECYITGLGNSGLMVPMVECMDSSNVYVEGLELDGRQAAWSHTEWKPGFNIEGSTNIHLYKCIAHDNKGDGVSISTMTPNKHNYDVSVRHCNMDSNYRGGIFLGEGRHIRIEYNTARFCTGTDPMFGMDIEPDGYQSIVEDVIVTQNDFSENGVEDTSGAGFYITLKDKVEGWTATGGTTTTITGTGFGTNTYRNCIVRWLTGNNAGEEQYIESSTNTTITLAAATDSATANGDTFEIVPRQRDIIVDGNLIESNGIQGIVLYPTRDTVIRNNHINNNGAQGIRITGRAENVLIDGNKITRNDVDCILLGSSSNRVSNNIRIVNNFMRGRRDGGDGIEVDTGDTFNYLTIANNDIGDCAVGIKVVGTLTEGIIGPQQWGTTTSAKTSGLTPSNVRHRVMPFVINNGSSTIATGIQKGDIVWGCYGVILGVDALADQSGSIVVDIWKDTYANYAPADADSITASAPVTISTATKSQDYTLTGWTKHFSPGDIFRFNVDSVTTLTGVTINLHYLEL